MTDKPFTLLPLEFRSVVTTLWGSRWWDAAADSLGMSARTLQRMAAGTRNYSPTPEIVRKLREIVADRLPEIEGRAPPQEVAYVKRVLRLSRLDLSPASQR